MRLLLESHIPPEVASELEGRISGVTVELHQTWRGGSLRTASDDELLSAAHEDALILVTFDVTTVPPLLKDRYERGVPSPAVILISAHTFRQNDIAGIADALSFLCRKYRDHEWTGQVFFLEMPPRNG